MDRLYVHKDYQRNGIASGICDALEAFSKGNTIYYQKAPCDGSHILHAFAQSEKEIINWLS